MILIPAADEPLVEWDETLPVPAIGSRWRVVGRDAFQLVVTSPREGTWVFPAWMQGERSMWPGQEAVVLDDGLFYRVREGKR